MTEESSRAVYVAELSEAHLPGPKTLVFYDTDDQAEDIALDQIINILEYHQDSPEPVTVHLNGTNNGVLTASFKNAKEGLARFREVTQGYKL